MKSRSVAPAREARSKESPKEKSPEFSMKKSRFSGKKSEKRVRFTCS